MRLHCLEHVPEGFLTASPASLQTRLGRPPGPRRITCGAPQTGHTRRLPPLGDSTRPRTLPVVRQLWTAPPAAARSQSTNHTGARRVTALSSVNGSSVPGGGRPWAPTTNTR